MRERFSGKKRKHIFTLSTPSSNKMKLILSKPLSLMSWPKTPSKVQNMCPTIWEGLEEEEPELDTCPSASTPASRSGKKQKVHTSQKWPQQEEPWGQIRLPNGRVSYVLWRSAASGPSLGFEPIDHECFTEREYDNVVDTLFRIDNKFLFYKKKKKRF